MRMMTLTVTGPDARLEMGAAYAADRVARPTSVDSICAAQLLALLRQASDAPQDASVIALRH